MLATSWGCEIHPYERDRTAEEILADGDGQAVAWPYDRSTPKSAVNNIVPVARELAPASSAPIAQTKKASPADLVAAKIAEAAAAAAAVNPFASAAGSFYAGLASLPPLASALGSNSRATAAVAATAAVVASKQAIDAKTSGGNTTSFVPATNTTSKVVTTPRVDARMSQQAQSTTGSPACPSEWFICDEASTYTRYFVIQGSDTIDHWKLNLTFDPVVFEDPALGVKASSIPFLPR